MISFLKGQVDTILGVSLIIDVAGVGYQVLTTDAVLTRYRVSKDIKLYTYMSVSENKIALYGFEKYQDVSFFELLTSVSGIGPKAGLALLNTASASDLAIAIVTEDIDLIKKAPGVGAKTASRLVLELKDKLKKITADIPVSKSSSVAKNTDSIQVSDAIDALLALGYNPKDVYNIVSQISQTITTTEEIIKKALPELTNI